MKKTTQILSLGILFLFVMSLSLSAQKCKYDYNKPDPITGEAAKGIGLNVESKMMVMGTGTIYRSNIGFNKIGETYYVNVELFYTGNLRENILTSNPLIIKLSNGETVTIYPQSDFLPSASANQYGVYTQYKAKYDIDAASLQKIAESAPTFFRLNLESRTYDRTLDSKDQKKFTNAARCILL
jgi:hypothetical protein